MPNLRGSPRGERCDSIILDEDLITIPVQADYADAIRYQAPGQDSCISHEAFYRLRDVLMGRGGRPTNDRFTRPVSSAYTPWKMELYQQSDLKTVMACCHRISPSEYQSCDIDATETLKTGTVCYLNSSKQPLNGEPREEFETWALKELAKNPPVVEWPPF